MSGYSVTMDDLVVVDFRTENMDDSVKQWRVSRHIPYAESCARQIWFAKAQDFEGFPLERIKGRAVTYHHGTDAYKFLIELNLGLHSQQFGETNITGQIFQSWGDMRRDTPHLAEQYDTLIQHLTADARFIRGNIMNGLKTERFELCARDLSKFSHDESVLIIAGQNKIGEPSVTTDRIARLVSQNKRQRASTVDVTHPDDAISKSIYKGMRALNQKGRILSDVSYINFRELSLAVEMYDRIYVTLPMDEVPIADLEIIDSWANREAKDNTLTHVRTNAKTAGRSSKPWRNADMKGFISPEDIAAEQEKRRSNNANLTRRAEDAIDLCIELRQEGKQPSRALFGKRKKGLIPTVK